MGDYSAVAYVGVELATHEKVVRAREGTCHQAELHHRRPAVELSHAEWSQSYDSTVD